jgi:uncharacterized protein YhaN
LPKVNAEQIQFDTDACTLLSEVKPGLALTDVNNLRLTVVQRTRIRQLAADHHTLQERLRGAADRAESIQGDWAQKNRVLEETVVPSDAGELARALDRAHGQGDLEASLHSETTALRGVQEQATGELERLTLWSGTLEQLESLSVPSFETVETFESELNTMGNEQALLRTQSEENRQWGAKLEGEVQALRLGGTVPMEAELEKARDYRERGWGFVRHAWREGGSDSEKEKAFDPEQPLAEAYEQSVADADDIADRLRREADRVAKLAGLLADREGCEEKAKVLEKQKASITARLEVCQRRWREAWQPAGIVPLSPKEMRAWLTRHAALLAQVSEVREHRYTVEQLQQRLGEHADELSKAMRVLDEPVRGEAERFSAFVLRSNACLQRLKDIAQERANLENEVKRLAAENEKATRARDKAQRDLDVWQREWQKAIAPLGLASDTSAEEASAVLEKLDTLFKRVDESTTRHSRAEDMQQYIDQFNADVAVLVRSLAPELGGLPSDQAVSRIQALLNKAQQDEVRFQTIEKQIEDEQKTLEAADDEISQTRNELQVLMERAHCVDLAALVEAEAKSASAHELGTQLDAVNKTLAGFTAGATLEGFLVEVGAVSADQLPFQIDELDREIRSLDEQRSQLEQEIGSQANKLHSTDGGEQAAIAAEEAQSELAAARAHIERYLRLRLASEVLRRHIERYREQNQDPIIKRAGEIFPRLTLGSFARLKTSFDEKDRPVLLGVRPSGEEVEVSGMSDGARDQLFLSLRLASLERQLIGGEPLPFIVDDVLIKFDDARAQAALEQLIEVAHRTQVFFFTHHARLAELAQKTVPSELLKVHQLG